MNTAVWPRPRVDADQRVRDLQVKLAAAQDRIAALEAEIGVNVVNPVLIGLSRAEANVFGVILRCPVASYSLLMEAVYGGRPDCDQPASNVLHVLVGKMRPKLQKLGIEIETVWGTGYRMSPESKAKAEVLIASARKTT